MAAMGFRLALALFVLSGPARAARVKEGDLEKALSGTHWRACLGLARAPGASLSPRANYLAGLCAMKLREPEAARPLLERARDGGFRPTVSWRKPPEELLTELDEYERTAPPPLELPGFDAKDLVVAYDRKSPWTEKAAAAAPEFEEMGRRVFGGPPPFTRLFLFSNHEAFTRFYALVVGPTEAHGTGGAGFAVMTEKNAAGRRGRKPLGVVLHELVHAWCQGYGRDRYDAQLRLPPWVAEGWAVYVEEAWGAEPGIGRAVFAQQLARHPEPVPYAQLRDFKSFHQAEENGVDYGLAFRLVTRLAGPPERGLALLPKVLDGYARGEDDERAWLAATGKSPAAEYAALSAELWKVRKPNEDNP